MSMTSAHKAASAGIATAAAIALLFAGGGAAYAAATPVNLGTAAGFAVLAASTVTNTGPSIISGDIGLAPGTAVTGFPPGVQAAGAAYIADGVAGQAKTDANAAFVSASTQTGSPGPATVIPAELGGSTFGPDLYQSAGVFQINGNVILDGGGDSTAIFIFRSTSTFITGAGSSVTLINSANPCNIFWIVPSSATLGTNSTLAGTILAQTSVTATTGADVIGRVIALTGAVTLDSNDITSTGCAPITVNPGSGITIEQAVINSAPAVPTLPRSGPEQVLLASSTAAVLVAGGLALLFARARRSTANARR